MTFSNALLRCFVEKTMGSHYSFMSDNHRCSRTNISSASSPRTTPDERASVGCSCYYDNGSVALEGGEQQEEMLQHCKGNSLAVYSKAVVVVVPVLDDVKNVFM